MYDIGTTAGTVAAGEKVLYIANNLSDVANTATALSNLGGMTNPITTRGDIIRGNSTPAAARYALGAAGLFLGSDGTDLLYRYPPGYMYRDAGRTSTPSDTAEHSILAANAATSGLFVSPAVGDAWDIRLGGTFLNNSGTSSYTSTIIVYFGSYALMTKASGSLTTSATARPWMVTLTIEVETVGAANTGTLRMAGMRNGISVLNPTGTATWENTGSGATTEFFPGYTTGTSANLVTNAASSFNVTATHSNATASMSTALTYCQVVYYPQNR
jgi:hypothetical protein